VAYSSAVAWLDKQLYPQFTSRWDDEVLRREVAAHLPSAERVLDFGAGTGTVAPLNCRGAGRRVHGTDLDRRIAANPTLDYASVADGGALPYRDESFDLVVANNVLEHLPNPDAVFREIARVLKPGGAFLFKTPNRHHYVTSLARLTPHWFHEAINQMRGRSAADTFPTRYEANTSRDVHRLAIDAGLAIDKLEFIEGRPEYCRLNACLYVMGAAYERVVNGFAFLSQFRVIILGVLRKA
jgi:SAM-dependent methyltransferase